MVMRLVAINLAMVKQAATLEGFSKVDVRIFAEYLDKRLFVDGFKPNKEEQRTYERVADALDKCPRTKLEITKVRRDMIKLSAKPFGNARLYGLSVRFSDNTRKKGYDPRKEKDQHLLWAITEMNQEEPLTVAVDSSVGRIISGKEVFKLYAKFSDCNKPREVERNIKNNSYKLERISAPEKSVSLDLPLNGYFPAFLFVGNRIPEKCNEGLAYVSSTYWGWKPAKNFHCLMESRASWFAIYHLTKPRDIKSVRDVQRLETEIAKLEKIVASQK